jgi:hypothetical protein
MITDVVTVFVGVVLVAGCVFGVELVGGGVLEVGGGVLEVGGGVAVLVGGGVDVLVGGVVGGGGA